MASTLLIDRKVKLKRENKYANFKFEPVKVPEFLLSCEDNRVSKQLIKKEYSKKINIFLKIIKKNVPGVNLSAFYRNSRNINFINVSSNSLKRFFIYGNTQAYFELNNKDNSCTIFTIDNVDESIYHEFLHMASTRKMDDFLYQGFIQNISGSQIGIGLTEGYTDLLSVRFFSDCGARFSGDVKLALISSLVELLIGYDKMTKYYFESDLYSLCQDLSSYLSSYQIYVLLKNIDYLYDNNFNKLCKQKYKKIYKKVLYILVRLNIMKIEKLYLSGNIKEASNEKKHLIRILTVFKYTSSNKYYNDIVNVEKALDIFENASKSFNKNNKTNIL